MMTPRTGLPTAATSPKASRRRKAVLLLLAIVIAVFVGSVYFSRPKIDPRFLGRWDVYIATSPDLDWLVGEPWVTDASFQSDGTGTNSSPHSKGASLTSFTWKMDRDDNLVWIHDEPFWSRADRNTWGLISKAIGRKAPLYPALKFVSQTENLIVTQHVDRPSSYFIFRRIH